MNYSELIKQKPGYYNWSKNIPFSIRDKIILDITGIIPHSGQCPNFCGPMKTDESTLGYVVRVFSDDHVKKFNHQSKVMLFRIGTYAGWCPKCDFCENEVHYSIRSRKPLTKETVYHV